VGNTAGPGTLKAGLVNGDVAVFLRVLDEVTDVTIVSNPKILTLNRQPARVLVGTRVGYLNTVSTETATTQTVEFLEVGTQLAVRPFVSKNGLIRLELRPQVSSFNLRQITDGTGSTITIPDEDTTEMTTNVMVRDGQTVVLGGLFTETTTASRRQVPLLGNIPLIGQAFRGNDDSTRRSEIIFLITPSIVNDTILTSTGDLANDFVEHARYGARKGLLPWSRERRVGQILIDARRLADEGRTEKALAKIDQALRLQPNSPDARAMRTEFTGEMRVAPTRAMIQSILHGELLENQEGMVNTEPEFAPLTEVNPLNDVEWPSPESVEIESEPVETEQFAEVTEEISAASTEGDEFEAMADGEFVAEALESVEPELYTEIVDPDGFESGSFEDSEFETAELEAGDFDSASDGMGSEFAEVASGQEGSFEDGGFEDESFEASSFEADSFDPESFDPSEYIEEVAGAEQSLPEDFTEDQWEEFGYEEVAPGIAIEQELTSIFGQLIISLPGGGALQLDWPLSASDWTSANSTGSSAVDEPSAEDSEMSSTETLFTEVPADDFE
jgi:hypothetical protein